MTGTVAEYDPFKSLNHIEFEDIVIKTLFVKPEIGTKVFPAIGRALFQNPQNGEIVEATKSFFAQNSRYPSTKELYDLHLTAEDVKAKFRGLGEVVISSYNDEFLLSKVEEFVRLRKTYTAILDAAMAIRTSGDMNSFDASTIEVFQKALNFSIQSKEGISAKNDMESFVEYLNKKNSFIPTFSPSINHFIGGGYASKALTVWYGESNMGKTTFLCNDSAYAFAQGYDVLYISLEMDKHEIMKKIAANLLQIPIRDLGKYDTEFYVNAMSKVSESDLVILEYPSFTVNTFDLLNAINDLKVKRKFKPHIIFLDYINCLSANRSTGGKKHEDLGFITKELENLAKELDVPIVTCSQFNRQGYGSTKPSAKDVGESIDIFKYSANGIAIARDPSMIAQNLYELHIIKNRYGPKDVSFLVRGQADIMKFMDADEIDVTSFSSPRAVENAEQALITDARSFSK